MNGGITCSSQELTLEQCDEMFVKGVLLIKDAVLGYAKHGLTGTEIGKRVRALGAKLSDSQARRYIQQFKVQGLLEEKPVHRATEWRREQRVANAQNAQMQQPKHPAPKATPPITHQPSSPEPLEPVRLSGVRELQPGEYTHQDYNKIIQLFQQINKLTNEHRRAGTFSSEEWFSILGSWENCGMCIRTQCDHIERSESDRDDAITVDSYKVF